jgi:hypothetical protein
MGGATNSSTGASQQESAIANQLFGETTPVRQEYLNQMLEGLKTGGIQAQMPIIQQAVDQSKGATSQALRQLDTNMGQAGIAGTPYGQQTRAMAAMQGAQGTAAIPTNIVRDFMGAIPGYSSNLSAQSMQGLSAVTGSEASIRNQQIASTSQMLSAMITSMAPMMAAAAA